MSIKLIIFDLDGVICDTPDMHFETFSKAYKMHTGNKITKKEHDIDFNGRSTKTKLNLLKQRDNLNDDQCNKIWAQKQLLTQDYVNDFISIDESKIELLEYLKKNNYLIACASNAIRQTVESILINLGIISYFDLILSNEDVTNTKPSAEIYLKAMIHFNCNPTNTLIIEDSKVGYEGAISTKADVLRVVNSKDVTIEKISSKLKKTNNMIIKEKYANNNLNIVIPMAGAGSRFEKAGYTFPKPLIEVNGKTMIQTVIDSLNIDANFIFIARDEHEQKYNISNYLKALYPNCDVVLIDGLTEGAACTVLKVKELINNDSPLLLANSDQFIEWDSYDFFKNNLNNNYDASILTFESSHPKWSYAKVNEDGLVVEVAEKNPISNIATVGIYWWARGADFVHFAEQMVSKNIRVNNEFYVCPVFNEAIQENKKIGIFQVDEMWGLGTPEDLENFLKNKINKNL
jgi:HAD superfamily hydrolase (TIGR01509 family)